MAAFSSFHFFKSGAQSRRAPLTSSPRGTVHRTTGLAQFAARVRGAVGGALLLLGTVLTLGFSTLVAVSFFLS
jgi:hypothetical protein